MDSRALGWRCNSGSIEERTRLTQVLQRYVEGVEWTGYASSRITTVTSAIDDLHAQYLSQFCFARVDGKLRRRAKRICKVRDGKSKSYALYAGLFSNSIKGDTSLFDLSALDALMAKIPDSRV